MKKSLCYSLPSMLWRDYQDGQIALIAADLSNKHPSKLPINQLLISQHRKYIRDMLRKRTHKYIRYSALIILAEQAAGLSQCQMGFYPMRESLYK